MKIKKKNVMSRTSFLFLYFWEQFFNNLLPWKVFLTRETHKIDLFERYKFKREIRKEDVTESQGDASINNDNKKKPRDEYCFWEGIISPPYFLTLTF